MLRQTPFTLRHQAACDKQREKERGTKKNKVIRGRTKKSSAQLRKNYKFISLKYLSKFIFEYFTTTGRISHCIMYL